MTADAFLDTNIFLYAQSKDPAEAGKKAIARELLSRPGMGLSAQVLGEFYVNATAKVEPPLSHEEADRILRRLEFYPIQALSAAQVYLALEIRARYQLSYWDSLILAAARELGCKRVYSEDFSDGQNYLGMEMVNPFRKSQGSGGKSIMV